jgi:hypothetical protein
MLDVEMVWLLSAGEGGVKHLAISDSRGKQQARRFLEAAGRGPFSLDSRGLFGHILGSDELRLSVPVARVRRTAGAGRLGEALSQFNFQRVSFAPL